MAKKKKKELLGGWDAWEQACPFCGKDNTIMMISYGKTQKMCDPNREEDWREIAVPCQFCQKEIKAWAPKRSDKYELL